ncbi:MAG: hypothetical protein WA103_01805 [Minisyncoccales bacterium]
MKKIYSLFIFFAISFFIAFVDVVFADCQNWTTMANVGGVLKYDPAIIYTADNKLFITLVGTDNALWANKFDPFSAKNEWMALNGFLTSGTNMVLNANGDIIVSAIGGDNIVWQRIYSSAGVWGEWQNTESSNFAGAGPYQTKIGANVYRAVKNSNNSLSIQRCVDKICNPGAVSGCKVCKIDGLSWEDDDSKCATGQKCEAGGCRICTGQECALPVLQTYVVPAVTDDKILPDSFISDNYKSESIFIKLAKNEYEPASFVINSDKDMSLLNISTEDLVGPAGRIPAANIDIRTVKVWWQAGVSVSDISHKQLVPELLLNDDSLVDASGSDNYIKLANGSYVLASSLEGIPGINLIDAGRGDRVDFLNPSNNILNIADSATLLPFSIKAQKNKQFWVTIFAPSSVAAGSYSGKIYINLNNAVIKTLTINVDVLPINLSKSKLTYGIYYAGVLGQNGTLSLTKNEQQMANEFKDLVKHGVDNPTMFEIKSQPDPEFGKFDINKILKLRSSQGINNQDIYFCSLSVPSPNLHLGLQNNYSENNNLEILKNSTSDLIRRARESGVDNVYIYQIDESDLNNQHRLNEIEAIHNVSGKVFDAQYDQNNKYSIAQYLDLLNSASTLDPTLAAKYHSYGHKIFSYSNPQSGEEKPETYRRNYGLLLWQKDYDGAMDFAYYWPMKNVWNDFDSTWRDHNFVYPTVDGVIDTIQWEGFREAVDDVRYLSTLLNRVAYAKTKGVKTTAIENWIVNLKQADLKTANLDSIRVQMANYIIGLPDPGEIVCTPKTCVGLGNYQCGSWSDGCGATISCGACAGGKTCNTAGQCVSQTTGGPVISDSDSQTPTETPQKMTRAEILQKIAQIKQLLVQLIAQLIAELQKQLAGIQK